MVHTGAVVLTMLVVQLSKKLIEIILVSDPVVLWTQQISSQQDQITGILYLKASVMCRSS